ncbi:uncharacterized protein LOC124363350 [Homalodisca vitripennis]|uniref:uncharacterized protein LOC124363350 n=1 Tax=Homalodisca vitripennis TaxID=197043 RepID=UPI001EEAFDC5|nr:uncharacterized protein LOC124363350 [Homalodisca vitripennis]
MNETRSAANRRVARIVPDELSSKGDNGPCLVLLQLESAFLENNWIRPAPLNNGMISVESKLVAWAWDLDAKNNLLHAVALKMASLSGLKCYHEYGVAHYRWEMCSYDTHKTTPGREREGALLVDDGYLTALKYENTNVLSPKSTPIVLMARLYWFISWVQYCVVDNTLKTSFVETDNTEDDLFPLPWSKKRSKSPSLKVNVYLSFPLTMAVLPVMQHCLSAVMF